MFLQKRGSGSWFLAKKTGGNIEYLENVGDDPDSWLQNEIIKAVALMNPGRIDDLRKIQKKRNPVLGQPNRTAMLSTLH